MSATEYLDKLPDEESIRDELGRTLKRAAALKEMLRIAKRLQVNQAERAARGEGVPHER